MPISDWCPFIHFGQVAPWMTTASMSLMLRSLFVCDQWTGEVSEMSNKSCDSHLKQFGVLPPRLISLFFIGQTIFFPCPKGSLLIERQYRLILRFSESVCLVRLSADLLCSTLIGFGWIDVEMGKHGRDKDMAAWQNLDTTMHFYQPEHWSIIWQTAWFFIFIYL